MGTTIQPNFDFSLIDGIKAEAEEFVRQQNETSENKGLFTVKSANKWIEEAKNRPIPKMLFGKLWFENELCILFADTNLGKSCLAVQIGDSISKGEAMKGFALEAHKQLVLYFDFELSDKQFEARYSEDFTNHYSFDGNFNRVEINPNSEIPTGIDFETYLNQSLESTVSETNTKIVIIDNLTYLRRGTETAKEALPLMKHLKALKTKYNLSILVLAHTPKRDLSKPITRNDLQGSKMLINFCDSSFAREEKISKISRVRSMILQLVTIRSIFRICDAVNSSSNIRLLISFSWTNCVISFNFPVPT